jgi:heme-degrading monooxygenase HmoA
LIARHWRGLARPGHADAYVDHLRVETVPQLSTIPGFAGAAILKREIPQGTEFVIITYWESLAAIERFAGRDAEAAVVPPEVQRLMLEFDHRVRHYDVVAQAGAARSPGQR